MQHLVEIGEGQVILSDSLYETHLISKMDYLDKQIELCVAEAINWESKKINASVITAHFDTLENLTQERGHTFADLMSYWRSREHNGES